jgi:hypothetical protein
VSKLCFSYPAGVSPEAGDGDAWPSASPGLRMMPASCYSYPMMCFSYPDDMPSGGNPGVVGSAPPGLRQLPTSTCFRY